MKRNYSPHILQIKLIFKVNHSECKRWPGTLFIQETYQLRSSQHNRNMIWNGQSSLLQWWLLMGMSPKHWINKGETPYKKNKLWHPICFYTNSTLASIFSHDHLFTSWRNISLLNLAKYYMQYSPSIFIHFPRIQSKFSNWYIWGENYISICLKNFGTKRSPEWNCLFHLFSNLL